MRLLDAMSGTEELKRMLFFCELLYQVSHIPTGLRQNSAAVVFKVNHVLTNPLDWILDFSC